MLFHRGILMQGSAGMSGLSYLRRRDVIISCDDEGKGGGLHMCTFKLRAALAVLVLFGTQACLAQAPQRAERPEVRVGEAAVYRDLTVRTGEKRDTTFVVTTVDADKIVSEMSGSTSGTRTFTRDYNLVEVK